MTFSYLDELFAAGANVLGSHMAGQAEEGVGDPDVVAASAAALADDLSKACCSRDRGR